MVTKENRKALKKLHKTLNEDAPVPNLLKVGLWISKAEFKEMCKNYWR